MMTVGSEPQGDLHLTRERVVLEVGEKHLAKLDTIVDPLVVTDLQTLVWAPHGHPEAVDALLHMSQVVLIDSVNEPDPASALAAGEGARRRTCTWSTWPGSAPRPGASAWHRPSTRPAGATSSCGSTE